MAAWLYIAALHASSEPRLDLGLNFGMVWSAVEMLTDLICDLQDLQELRETA